MTSRTVTIICKSVPDYRVAFFDHLRKTLQDRDIHLRILYGRPTQLEATRGDFASLSWGTETKNRSVRLGSRELIWQPCLRVALESDIVIVEQASRLLANHLIFGLHSIGKAHLAFWGHGKNLKGHSASRAAERLKAFESKRVHWWFAYTRFTSELLQTMGVSPDRITVVENTIDVRALERAHAALTPNELVRTREQLGLKSRNCALFVGGMYSEKRIGFLLEAAQITRSLVPNFELLLLGAGPDDKMVRDFAARCDWIHHVGSQSGQHKVRYFALSKLLLLPGLVGLPIVDSFALRLPVLTVDLPYHSPEIAYLRNNENGLMLPSHTTPAQYAQATAALLQDESKRLELILGCERSAKHLSLENMVSRFSNGINRALNDL